MIRRQLKLKDNVCSLFLYVALLSMLFFCHDTGYRDEINDNNATYDKRYILIAVTYHHENLMFKSNFN